MRNFSLLELTNRFYSSNYIFIKNNSISFIPPWTIETIKAKPKQDKHTLNTRKKKIILPLILINLKKTNNVRVKITKNSTTNKNSKNLKP